MSSIATIPGSISRAAVLGPTGDVPRGGTEDFPVLAGFGGRRWPLDRGNEEPTGCSAAGEAPEVSDVVVEFDREVELVAGTMAIHL